MKNLVINLENKTIRKYGFESKATIRLFKVTSFLRKIFNIE